MAFQFPIPTNFNIHWTLCSRAFSLQKLTHNFYEVWQVGFHEVFDDLLCFTNITAYWWRNGVPSLKIYVMPSALSLVTLPRGKYLHNFTWSSNTKFEYYIILRSSSYSIYHLSVMMLLFLPSINKSAIQSLFHCHT